MSGADPNEELAFLDDWGDGEEDADRQAVVRPWKMLVVDDEPEVHSITKLVLGDFRYKDRPIAILSAHSAAEAIEVLSREEDIAMILLDVVMETEDAGLQLVHHIREVIDNRRVRIILRTGQPGQAPERSVILSYDINDYKAKTQLTAQGLFTTTVAALRAYEDIVTLDAYRCGLEKIIESASNLFRKRSLSQFAAGVLTQLSALAGTGPDGILCVQRGDPDGQDRSTIHVLAGSGRFEAVAGEATPSVLAPEVWEAILEALRIQASVYRSHFCSLYIRTPNQRECVIYLRSTHAPSDLNRRLIELFCGRISVGFDNIQRIEQFKRSQEAVLLLLAHVADPPVGDTTQDPTRIADYAERLARSLSRRNPYAAEIDEAFLELIGPASFLHDIGNATLDRSMLLKPGVFTPEERAIMERHTVGGAAMLDQAAARANDRATVAFASQIARSHHENYDGGGYPDGLKADDIPLAARIVAVVDVYEALISDRPHRPAFTAEQARAELAAMAGRRLDPGIVAAFLDETKDDGEQSLGT